MAIEEVFSGWIELRNEDGAPRVEIYNDEGYYYAYVDGNLADDVDSAEEFADNYGNALYSSMDDFRNHRSKEVFEYWPRKES